MVMGWVESGQGGNRVKKETTEGLYVVGKEDRNTAASADLGPLSSAWAGFLDSEDFFTKVKGSRPGPLVKQQHILMEETCNGR
jgi:hypothetical protein